MKKLLVDKIKQTKLFNKWRLLLAKIVVKIVKSFQIGGADFIHYDFFDYWARNGFFIIPNHFYQPITDPQKIDKKIFNKKSLMIGVNFNDKNQLKLLESFREYSKEYNQI